jgi:hypothetical protein
MFCCFLPAIQESTSLKELQISFPRGVGPSILVLENMLTQTQSVESLSLSYSDGLDEDRAVPLEDIAVAAVSSGLKKNTTLRELTLEFAPETTNVSPILTSLCNHPLLRRLCLRGKGVNLTGLETVLLSRTSKITELVIDWACGSQPTMGLTRVLQALARHPALTKLGLSCPLGRDEARLLRLALCSMPSLQSLDLACSGLNSVGLAELAPAFYRNTSMKLLDISFNGVADTESASILRNILRRNKTMTALDLGGNRFGLTAGAFDYIADGLGSNSTLLKIDLSYCHLRDNGVSALAQTLGSRNTTLQNLVLGYNSITSAGVGLLLETMEYNCHITDLDLRYNPIRDEGASLLARYLGNNTLPNLTSLSLFNCRIHDDGFIALVTALEQNTSLLQLDLRNSYGHSERVFLALAESLPEIRFLQRFDTVWCAGLVLAMPLLLAGLRKNTSLFRFHVAYCEPYTARSAGGWMQEMECLGYRNRFLPLLRAPKERLPPRGVWPLALARVAILPDVIFEVLRSKPNLVLSEDTEGKEAAEDTGVLMKRKRGDD